jgi:hypothetical protein
MSVPSAGASSHAYAYLQSLLQRGSTDSSNAAGAKGPLGALLSAFYPAADADRSSASAPPTDAAASGKSTAPPAWGMACAGLSPDTIGALISMQGQCYDSANSISSRAQSLFAKLDSSGDGQVTKAEFENGFGTGADTSKVDDLFDALDGNSDGSVSVDELTSAARASHSHHHHHTHGAGSGQDGGLKDLLAAAGARSETATNADGSTTTTISYADGSKVAMTTPAAASSGDSGSQNSATGSNILEQLIRLQAQMLAQSASTPPSSVTATVS